MPMASPAAIISRVKIAIEDQGGDFFSMKDYVDAYNEALDEIAEITEINEQRVYVKRRKWAVYHDLRGCLPPTALRITGVWNPSTNRWLDPTTPRELDQSVGRLWEHAISTQTRWWFMRGMHIMGAYPAAGDDISPLRIHYTALLPHAQIHGGLVTGLSAPADLPADTDDVVEFYMMYYLLTARKEIDKSLVFYKRFVDAMPALRDLAENRMRKDRIPKMGARR